MNKIIENLDNQVKQTRQFSMKIILPLVVAGMLLSPSHLSADWSFMDAAKKIVKKVALPATALVHGVASAAEAYSDGYTASEIAAFGVGGAAAHIGNAMLKLLTM